MTKTTLLLKIVPLILFILMLFSSMFVPASLRTEIIDLYIKNFREILFSAFLTLSGFVFTLETFIIVTIKENVYDNEKYIKKFLNMKKINPQLSRYAPLIRLKHFLYYTIVYSFMAAMFQLIFGVFYNWFTILLCIWSSFIALLTFVYALHISNNNLKKWFECIEDDDK